MAKKTSDPVALYERTLQTDLTSKQTHVAIKIVGTLIDLSDHLSKPEGAQKSLEFADQLESRQLKEKDSALLQYFRANAWAVLQHNDEGDPWSWEQPSLAQQIYYLRKCIAHSGFAALEELRRCQVFSNLGNIMDTVGRFVEALECWEHAIALNPKFGMAVGNRSCGLENYARSLYDSGHQSLFLKFAHEGLILALGKEALYDGPYPHALAHFDSVRQRIETHIRNPDQISLHEHPMGKTQAEQAYRTWCLRKRLFLNPLNDLGVHSIANRDALMMPTFTTKIDEPPSLVGFFNQIKQEFVSARWLFYEGISLDRVHFSDREVLLYNTLDYPSHSLSVEKTKIAFRMAYSLFDKLAFFLNEYLQLGIKSREVYFKTLWYQHRSAKPFPLRPKFLNLDNWPFRGLFWLAKDLFDERFSDVIEPEAQDFYVIRNHLEHSSLRVHEGLQQSDAAGFDIFGSNRLAYSISRAELDAKTLRLLKLVRAALIYLMLGMHREESRRVKTNDTTAVSMPMTLWEDDWKR